MYKERLELYKKLEEKRNSRVIVYVTGDRPNLSSKIHPEVLDLFMTHFDEIGIVDKITLYLYTRGGITLAAWSLVNLIRQFCNKEFEVIVPGKAHSAGTLICLGADNIVMTKQATLGPIDPSVETPLNPRIPGAQPLPGVPTPIYPVSVEDINGFIQLAKEQLGIYESNDLAIVLETLAQKVDPLVLGKAYRTRNQIRMLGNKLLAKQINESEKAEKILDFLCSDSGSHDYTIFRREARELGLKVETPSMEQYRIIKDIYDDISGELELTKPYDPVVLLAEKSSEQYILKQALIESVAAGTHYFCRKGVLSKHQLPSNQGLVQHGIHDQITFNGWEYEKSK
jgi:hypothetical protein